MTRDSIIRHMLVLLLLGTASAFAPSVRPFSKSPAAKHNALFQRQSTTSLLLSGDNAEGDAPKRRRKRVKRKETVEEQDVEESAPPEVKPREDGPVQLQVQDVRNLVGGGGPAPRTTTSLESTSMAGSQQPASSSGGTDDSLLRLLEDAKEMQALEDTSAVSTGEEDGEFSLPDTLRKVVSTIVTVDFFIVFAFLLWFLAGIFCSYILKDDTVQIAFNQQFQPLVQPALGILMIASVAGSFLDKDEEENA
ncbi:expressed unknown protein [Seminavis robusta]|uniref:Transmembrane protein n=1 Tax=Seminavis robusta TaxID=568900 RepID=A0A9N8H833_9STRA|nr:expressed unknown protein [Seminavis robusta]|eukprot:Sro82_g043780.1 n/a (250) ;mRNA; r:37454-38299